MAEDRRRDPRDTGPIRTSSDLAAVPFVSPQEKMTHSFSAPASRYITLHDCWNSVHGNASSWELDGFPEPRCLRYWKFWE